MSLEPEKPFHMEESRGESNESSLQSTAMPAESEKPSQTEQQVEGNENSNPTRVEFESPRDGNPRAGREDLEPVQEIRPSRTSMSMIAPGLAGLHTPHKKRRLILGVGVVLATLDLCCLPIT